MRISIWSEMNNDARRACLARPNISRDQNVIESVNVILDDIKTHGDDAVYDYTRQFDGAAFTSLSIDIAVGGLDQNICRAIDVAYENIRCFHEQQGYSDFSLDVMQGLKCSRIVRPLETVGLYVPGGSAPLVSTALMLGVPAQIAGCPNVVMCTPSSKNGDVNPYIIYAAKLCGVDQMFRIGGAQAIAAMAYGTQSVPKVDKVFGPGNAYVTQAKLQVAQSPDGVAIDMPAGPSEVCVIVDDKTNPAFAAADLLSQAEHDPMSQVVLIGTSQSCVKSVMGAVEKQLVDLPRHDIARQAIKNSRFIVAVDMDNAIEIANAYAAEHLILCFDNAAHYLDKITHAGSIFVGQWTPESMGDYASGTNHVLPTYGYARMYSGLSVEAFQKAMSVQSATRKGLQNLGPTVETLAELEGLDAHARAVSIRREAL